MPTYFKRISAVLLLFLFLEKAGVRLWIHTHYHECAIEGKLSSKSDTSPSFSAQPCDCVDDFFIPITFTEQIIFTSALCKAIDLYFNNYKSPIPEVAPSSPSLRGPPVC